MDDDDGAVFVWELARGTEVIQRETSSSRSTCDPPKAQDMVIAGFGAAIILASGFNFMFYMSIHEDWLDSRAVG